MSNSLVSIGPEKFAAIRSNFDHEIIPLPYGQEIFLLQCHVAGTSYLQIDEIEQELLPGDNLFLQREPDNIIDELAILIKDKEGNRLGYIPWGKNEILARLMDAGKYIFAKLEEKDWVNEWLKLTIKLYLRDL